MDVLDNGPNVEIMIVDCNSLVELIFNAKLIWFKFSPTSDLVDF